MEVHDFGTSYLDDGKNSEHVKELQRFLKGTGHYNYKDGPTGYFGPLTAEAVRKWQRKYGLPESGGWGAQSRATYLQVKHAELRAMRDPEAAASWAKSAMANGLVSKATGLPVPPSIGDGRAGEARPSWVASAGTGTAGASGGKLMDQLPGIGGPASYVAAAILAVGVIFGLARAAGRATRRKSRGARRARTRRCPGSAVPRTTRARKPSRTCRCGTKTGTTRRGLDFPLDVRSSTYRYIVYTRVVLVIQTLEQKRTIARHPRKLVSVYKTRFLPTRALRRRVRSTHS